MISYVIGRLDQNEIAEKQESKNDLQWAEIFEDQYERTEQQKKLKEQLEADK